MLLGSGTVLSVHRLAAAAPIRPLAWKPPHAMGVALEKTKQKNQKVTFSLSPAEWHLGNELPGRGSGSESWRAGEVAGPGVAVWGQAVRDGSCLRRVSTAALLGGHQGLAVLCKSSRGLHPPESPFLHRRVQTPCRTSPPGAPHPSAPAELASRPPSQAPPKPALVTTSCDRHAAPSGGVPRSCPWWLACPTLVQPCTGVAPFSFCSLTFLPSQPWPLV